MLNIKQADVLEDIKTYKDYFFDIIYSDPPYNLSSEWFIDTDGQYKIKRKAKDFLNKWEGLTETEFDIFFKESYRTLKHGGYLIMYGIDRQLGPFHYYAVKNGFEVSQSLYWFFMSNFPKASDVSKMIDKRFNCEREVVGKENPYKDGSKRKATGNVADDNVEFLGEYKLEDGLRNITSATHPIAKKYEGYKYSIAPLKQCLETIMVFHKPLKNKSYIDDIIECEKDCSIHSSCLNIEGERVEYKDDSRPSAGNRTATFGDEEKISGGNGSGGFEANDNGRFPSQLLVDENAAAVIDNQTGVKTSKGNIQNDNLDCEFYSGGFNNRIVNTPPETEAGGSKILHTCRYEEEEIDLLKYNPKVSKSERNAGLEGFEEKEHKHTFTASEVRIDGSEIKKIKETNGHPTLKPISLNKHILNLFKTPNHTRIYIPFSGSGSEVIAASLVGYDEIYACEINEEYVKIAEARIKHWCKSEEPEDDFWS